MDIDYSYFVKVYMLEVRAVLKIAAGIASNASCSMSRQQTTHV